MQSYHTPGRIIASRGETATINCPECGSPFVAFVRDLKYGRGRYCKRQCAYSARSKRTNSPEHIRSRILAKLVPQARTSCLWWSGAANSDGYGVTKVAGKMVPVHRLMWHLTNGPIPDGLSVLHSCDAQYDIGDTTYRRCANVDHLWLGTHQDNMRDEREKGRSASGDRNAMRLYPESRLTGMRNHSAKLTDDNVREIRALRSAGMSRPKIAAIYGVHPCTIRWIDIGHTWAHLD